MGNGGSDTSKLVIIVRRERAIDRSNGIVAINGSVVGFNSAHDWRNGRKRFDGVRKTIMISDGAKLISPRGVGQLYSGPYGSIDLIQMCTLAWLFSN